MGIRLAQAGLRDFTIFDRGDTAGGVWRDNTYPGAACDVPSHLYSFSFAPNRGWSRRYSGQAQTLGSRGVCARACGLEPHLRLRTEVEAAEWDGRVWRLRLAGGEEH